MTYADGLFGLLTSPDGRACQVTSVDRDAERGGTWWGLRPADARRKRILLAPGETHTLATLTGAGLITRIWMTTLLPINPRALRNVVLRFYWDGEEEPSVECPLGDFFGAPFGRYREYAAAPMSLASGGFSCAWPMPYASGARLEMTNEGRSVIDPVFYQVTFYQGVQQTSDLRFHSHWRRENPTDPGSAYTVLEAKGAGHYVGCHLFLQNRQWWLTPRLPRVIFPYGFGLGMLEGWDSVWIDGGNDPALQGTGTEDSFNAGWYFLKGTFCTPSVGCTVRNWFRGRVAAYRFDIAAPIPFKRALRVTFDHGFENRLTCDYTSVAYWYQTEPHTTLPPIPAAAARQPASTCLNVVQSALLLGIPALALLGFVLKLVL